MWVKPQGTSAPESMNTYETEYMMYWSSDFCYDRIASATTLKRYQTLRRYLHENDNTEKNNEQNVNDKLFKVRTLLKLVRNNCIKIESEQWHSTDKQISENKKKWWCQIIQSPKNP